MFASLTLVAVLVSVAPCALSLNTAVRFKNQDAYESFLIGLDMKVEEDKERQKEYMYVPLVRDYRYDVDRHGQEYVRCREYNDTDIDGGKNVRCTRRSANFDPMCYVTLNYDGEQIKAGCMEIPVEDQVTCQSTCNIKRGEYTLEGDSSRTVSIGHCCCTSYMCNSDYREIISRELAGRRMRRSDKVHHHHHQAKEGSPKSVDNASSFFKSLF